MKRVELHTAQWVKPRHENDYCVRDGLMNCSVDFGGGYAQLSRKARRISRHLGEEVVDGNWYPETDSVQKGLAAVFIKTSEYEDNILQSETCDYFADGHYTKSIKYKYSEGGKVSRTEYVKEQ